VCINKEAYNLKYRMMIIRRKSQLSGEYSSMNINVTAEQIQQWQDGALIQNAMPDLNSDEREFLKTGITASEWNETFSEEEE
jgi:hypothetical protein